ncbi:uncharacterized protein [Primulina eburnea]|uniref:uncharacterized protein n=1 Tax=Primulina eburnea TaxID=1245227 RepID=UPI003C6BED0D
MPPRCVIDREARDEDRELREERRDAPPPPPPPPDMQAAVDAGARPRPEAVYERFRRMSPKEFPRITDPMIAEGWTKSIEVIFDFMEMTDADKVRCSTFLLSGDARLWWESASVSINLQTLSWNGFKEIFYSKYFTEEVRSRLTREFMTLRQGDNSVVEFVRKFERGCHFVPLIANDVQAKFRHFMDGLRPILHLDVRVSGPTTYATTVSRALAAEQDQRDIDNDRQGKRPYQAPQQPQQHQQRPHLRSLTRGSKERGLTRDHQKARSPFPSRRLLRGWERNIFIKRLSTKALIDSRATHSFISETFANHLDIKSIGLDVNYSVTVPSGKELVATSVVKDIDLELQGHLVYADLIILPMPESDIILDMNWLTKNRVLIDFQKRSVLVRPMRMEQFLFEPDRWRSFPRMISCMQARKLISKGCQAFLDSIISTHDIPAPSPSDEPIVRDFPDVFPETSQSMRRSQNLDLLIIDPKIERTVRRLRKAIREEIQAMDDNRDNENPPPAIPIRDRFRPVLNAHYSGIA